MYTHGVVLTGPGIGTCYQLGRGKRYGAVHAGNLAAFIYEFSNLV